MGRYYYGDIEGKFMFGVQSSRAAERFGVEGVEPSYIEYYFTEDDLEQLQDELKLMEDSYWLYFQEIEKFFNDHDGYVNEELMQYLALENENEFKKILSEYADYRLGKKIEATIIKNGECNFTAELM